MDLTNKTEQNKVGVHNSELSTMIVEQIKAATGLTLKDVSWGNDLCDSIIVEELKLHIYLPNSTYTDYEQEKFYSYSIQQLDEAEAYLDGEEPVYIEGNQLESLIQYLKDYKFIKEHSDKLTLREIEVCEQALLKSVYGRKESDYLIERGWSVEQLMFNDASRLSSVNKLRLRLWVDYREVFYKSDRFQLNDMIDFLKAKEVMTPEEYQQKYPNYHYQVNSVTDYDPTLGKVEKVISVQGYFYELLTDGAYVITVDDTTIKSKDEFWMEARLWDFMKFEVGAKNLEEDLHQRARDLMESIDEFFGRSSRYSLDEYLYEFEHTAEDKEKILYLLRMFDELHRDRDVKEIEVCDSVVVSSSEVSLEELMDAQDAKEEAVLYASMIDKQYHSDKVQQLFDKLKFYYADAKIAQDDAGFDFIELSDELALTVSECTTQADVLESSFNMESGVEKLSYDSVLNYLTVRFKCYKIIDKDSGFECFEWSYKRGEHFSFEAFRSHALKKLTPKGEALIWFVQDVQASANEQELLKVFNGVNEVYFEDFRAEGEDCDDLITEVYNIGDIKALRNYNGLEIAQLKDGRWYAVNGNKDYASLDLAQVELWLFVERFEKY